LTRSIANVLVHWAHSLYICHCHY